MVTQFRRHQVESSGSHPFDDVQSQFFEVFYFLFRFFLVVQIDAFQTEFQSSKHLPDTVVNLLGNTVLFVFLVFDNLARNHFLLVDFVGHIFDVQSLHFFFGFLAFGDVETDNQQLGFLFFDGHGHHRQIEPNQIPVSVGDVQFALPATFLSLGNNPVDNQLLFFYGSQYLRKGFVGKKRIVLQQFGKFFTNVNQGTIRGNTAIQQRVFHGVIERFQFLDRVFLGLAYDFGVVGQLQCLFLGDQKFRNEFFDFFVGGLENENEFQEQNQHRKYENAIFGLALQSNLFKCFFVVLAHDLVHFVEEQSLILENILNQLLIFFFVDSGLFIVQKHRRGIYNIVEIRLDGHEQVRKLLAFFFWKTQAVVSVFQRILVKLPEFDDFVRLNNLFLVICGIGDEIQNQDFLGQLLAEHPLFSRNIDDSRIAQLAVEIVLYQQLAQEYRNRNGQEGEDVQSP